MNNFFINNSFRKKYKKNLYLIIIILKYVLYLIIFVSIVINLSFDLSIFGNKFVEEDEYIIKNNKSFLKVNIIEKFNNYLKICKQGKLINKKKYPLLKHPKITIIIPIYNGGKYLNYSLRTIQNQKLKEIEIIIIDDCSTDESLTNIKKLMNEDPRIILIKNNKNRKILYSKSIAALNSNGEYILELDQDDMFLREDLFDIIYKESKKYNLDLVQFRDFIKENFFFKRRTRINFDKDHWIFPKETFYYEEPELKETLFTNSNNYLLWGLLILSKLYKKAIYILWEFIINYELIYNEDYIITTMIIFLAQNYKYLNMFGIVHLKHKEAASFDFIEKNVFHLSNIIFPSYLHYYYIKNNPKNIKLAFNYIYSHKVYQKKASFIYKKIFDYNLRNLFYNNYLLTDIKKEILDLFNITKNQSSILSTYAFFMEYKEFYSIMKFQNFIFNFTKMNIKHNSYMINEKNLDESIFKRFHFPYIYINDSKSKIDINKIIKLKYKTNKNQTINCFRPNISIITYCNEIKYLEQTLISIIEQEDFFFFEIIIVYDNINKMILSNNFTFNNILIINNLNQKGIIYSFSIGALASKGRYILCLQSGYTLAKKDILKILYNCTKHKKIDMLEFNLLINKDDIINENSFNLYKCQHLNSSFNSNAIKYNKNHKELDQEKELLINKLIRASIFKDIIYKYKLIEANKIHYNYYDEILIFLFSKRKHVFKHINLFGVIKNINQINSLKLNQIINNNDQKIVDAVFYINFLFKYSPNRYIDKKSIYDKYVNILGLINNKLVPKSNISIKLLKKFLDSKYIKKREKLELLFFYNSLNH